jgi:hypothetical protein
MSPLAERYQIERIEDWESHIKQDYFSLRPNYEISVIPPLRGALMRFSIRYFHREFSVYFDGNDAFGTVRKPYFEVYPIDGDALRAFSVEEILFAIYEECEGVDVLRQEYPDRYL